MLLTKFRSLALLMVFIVYTLAVIKFLEFNYDFSFWGYKYQQQGTTVQSYPIVISLIFIFLLLMESLIYSYIKTFKKIFIFIFILNIFLMISLFTGAHSLASYTTISNPHRFDFYYCDVDLLLSLLFLAISMIDIIFVTLFFKKNN